MKKHISFLIFICFSFSLLFSNDNHQFSKDFKNTSQEKEENSNSFGYVSPGITACLLFPVPLPNIGMGYRLHNEIFGMDICISAYPYIIVNGITADGSLLFYSKKNIYGGFGATGSFIVLSKAGIFGGHYKSVLLNFIIGKEYLNKECEKRFLQLEIGSPPYIFAPFIAFKYGISF